MHAEPTVAFVGLGRMGAPMAANLAAAGHHLLVHNRTRERADAFAERAGCEVAATPRAAALRADVVITMLADVAAVREVAEGDDGLLAAGLDDTVVVDMSTTGPEGVAWLASRVADAGGVLVDAPVSGSVASAERGELVVMAGGPEASVAAVMPVLESMASSVFHLGDTGAGAIAKLAVNNIIFALGNAVSESLVLAERCGLDRARIYEVFTRSAAGAPMLDYRRAAFVDPDHTPPAFAMTLARKDLELITDLAAQVGLRVEQATANLSLIDQAIEAGLGEHDMADVAVHLRRSGGAPPPERGVPRDEHRRQGQ